MICESSVQPAVLLALLVAASQDIGCSTRIEGPAWVLGTFESHFCCTMPFFALVANGLVYSANQWFEGTILRADGLSATVLYDDDGADGQSEEHADFGKFKYTLVAKPAGGQEPGEAIAGHTCNRCHTLHQHVDAPSDRVCCSQCKSSFHEVGSGQRKVRRNTVGP